MISIDYFVPNKTEEVCVKTIDLDVNLSNRIREIYPNNSDDVIPYYIRRDCELTSRICGFFKSGDDSWII